MTLAPSKLGRSRLTVNIAENTSRNKVQTDMRDQTKPKHEPELLGHSGRDPKRRKARE